MTKAGLTLKVGDRVCFTGDTAYQGVVQSAGLLGVYIQWDARDDVTLEEWEFVQAVEGATDA